MLCIKIYTRIFGFRGICEMKLRIECADFSFVDGFGGNAESCGLCLEAISLG